jgi:hypothetical protein
MGRDGGTRMGGWGRHIGRSWADTALGRRRMGSELHRGYVLSGSAEFATEASPKDPEG